MCVILEGWGLFVDGVNPVARTNAAPEVAPPAEPSLHGFSFTRPSDDAAPPTFVVAGAGELLIGDKRYSDAFARLEREAEVDEIIAGWTRHRGKMDAMRAVGEAGIPAGAVLDTMELDNDPSFEQRGIMQVMKHPLHRDFRMPGWPVRIDGKPPKLTASPVLGEHTGTVLSEWLGLNAQAIEALRAEGAV